MQQYNTRQSGESRKQLRRPLRCVAVSKRTTSTAKCGARARSWSLFQKPAIFWVKRGRGPRRVRMPRCRVSQVRWLLGALKYFSPLVHVACVPVPTAAWAAVHKQSSTQNRCAGGLCLFLTLLCRMRDFALIVFWEVHGFCAPTICKQRAGQKFGSPLIIQLIALVRH